jgi:uncharacterized protein YhhL (DUF1145 family)
MGLRTETAELSEVSGQEKIRTVARIFTYIGWPLAILTGLLAIVGAVVLIVLLFTAEGRQQFFAALIGVLVFGVFAYLGMKYVSVAKRLRARDPHDATTARLLCLPLLIGFPIFTIAGLYCLALLGQYDDYWAAEST